MYSATGLPDGSSIGWTSSNMMPRPGTTMKAWITSPPSTGGPALSVPSAVQRLRSVRTVRR